MCPNFIPTLAVFASVLLLTSPAEAHDVVRHEASPPALIHPAVTVRPGARVVFVSGQMADPQSLHRSPASHSEAVDFGDTKAQTVSALRKIEAILATQGLRISDVVKLTVYLVGDPALGGRMDFAGMNAGFQQFFRTAENPTTVARSTVQVAGLAGAGHLVEIEAVAAR